MNRIKQKKYCGIALDPIHIGAGGYRLGRVDNTIVRDPTTDVPKIPGTSLAGMIREYATTYVMGTDSNCKNKSDEKRKRKCAEEKVKKYFGDENRQGIFRFYDGQMIFFPVSSIQGTVWITTKELLEYWFGEVEDKNGEKIKIPENIEDNTYAIKGINASKPPLNLGWLMLEVENITHGKEIILSEHLMNFVKRIVMVSDKLFSQIVNDNLEVRTSVRIDTTTGTAAAGALFTYEAIPRGTVLGFEIVIDKRREKADNIDSLIKATFPYLKLVGIGGLGTRGFGRLRVFELDKNKDDERDGGE